MRLRIITLLLGVCGVFISSSGQEQFTFNNSLRDTINLKVDESAVSNHYLGEEIALKYYRVKETYTFVTPSSPTNPVTQTVIEKPVIYNSLKRLNSHYKKQLRKGMIDSSTARKELGWYFDVGFAIYTQDTSDFEQALKGARKPDQIQQLFAQVILE